MATVGVKGLTIQQCLVSVIRCDPAVGRALQPSDSTLGTDNKWLSFDADNHD